MRNTLFAGICLISGLLFCCCAKKTANHHHSTPVNQIQQLVLLDMQGMHGGQDLWISSDGKAICRFAEPPKSGGELKETRYEFVLSSEQLTRLDQLIHQHNFFSIQTKKRYGVPGEVHAKIFVSDEANNHAVGKWLNDEHEDFDAIYEFLLQITESGKQGKKVHQGKYDWDWSPDGFPENQSILERTKPRLD